MESEIFFYWLTITSLLLTMLFSLRDNNISDLVSCGAIIAFYASGSFGETYNYIYETISLPLIGLDALYLLIVMAIIFATWLIPKFLLTIFSKSLDFKGLVCSCGEKLLLWIAMYVVIIGYDILYDNSTPLICSLVIPLFLWVRSFLHIRSNNGFSDEQRDDYMTFALIITINVWLFMWWINTSLIGNEIIVNAFGVSREYNFTISVTLIPVILLFLPVIFWIFNSASSIINSVVDFTSHEEDDDNKCGK